MSRLAPGTPIEVWFQDEMRVGQKNSLVYQWARKGSRPRQPKDQRYENAYVFGAVCPSRDTGVALIMPYTDTEAMQAHLDTIGRAVAPSRQGRMRFSSSTRPGGTPRASSTHPAISPLSRCRRHARNSTPPRTSGSICARPISPFADYTAILDACQDAWRKLLAETGRITSIAQRDWSIIGQSL